MRSMLVAGPPAAPHAARRPTDCDRSPMLAALLTILLINLALRGVVWCVRAFLRWLDEGPQLRHLVDEGYLPQNRVESAEAAEIRQFADACDEWRREMRLGRRTRADRPRLTLEQRRVVRDLERQARAAYLDNMTLSWFHIVSVFVVASFLGLIIE